MKTLLALLLLLPFTLFAQGPPDCDDCSTNLPDYNPPPPTFNPGDLSLGISARLTVSNTHPEQQYLLQRSLDLVSWSDFGLRFNGVGTNSVKSILFTNDHESAFFRVQDVTGKTNGALILYANMPAGSGSNFCAVYTGYANYLKSPIGVFGWVADTNNVTEIVLYDPLKTNTFIYYANQHAQFECGPAPITIHLDEYASDSKWRFTLFETDGSTSTNRPLGVIGVVP